MGAAALSHSGFPVAAAFQREDWRRFSREGDCELWEHRRRGFLASAHPIEGELSVQQLHVLQLRYDHPELVQVFGVMKETQEFICSRSEGLSLFVEHVPLTLSEIPSLTPQQGIAVFTAVFNGLNLIGSLFGPITPRANLIAFNQDGQPKVWINERFQRNSPSQPSFCQNKDVPLQTANNIAILTDLVAQRVHPPRTLQPLFRRLTNRRIDYSQALKIVQQYQIPLHHSRGSSLPFNSGEPSNTLKQSLPIKINVTDPFPFHPLLSTDFTLKQQINPTPLISISNVKPYPITPVSSFHRNLRDEILSKQQTQQKYPFALPFVGPAFKPEREPSVVSFPFSGNWTPRQLLSNRSECKQLISTTPQNFLLKQKIHQKNYAATPQASSTNSKKYFNRPSSSFIPNEQKKVFPAKKINAALCRPVSLVPSKNNSITFNSIPSFSVPFSENKSSFAHQISALKRTSTEQFPINEDSNNKINVLSRPPSNKIVFQSGQKNKILAGTASQSEDSFWQHNSETQFLKEEQQTILAKRRFCSRVTSLQIQMKEQIQKEESEQSQKEYPILLQQDLKKQGLKIQKVIQKQNERNEKQKQEQIQVRLEQRKAKKTALQQMTPKGQLSSLNLSTSRKNDTAVNALQLSVSLLQLTQHKNESEFMHLGVDLMKNSQVKRVQSNINQEMKQAVVMFKGNIKEHEKKQLEKSVQKESLNESVAETPTLDVRASRDALWKLPYGNHDSQDFLEVSNLSKLLDLRFSNKKDSQSSVVSSGNTIEGKEKEKSLSKIEMKVKQKINQHSWGQRFIESKQQSSIEKIRESQSWQNSSEGGSKKAVERIKEKYDNFLRKKKSKRMNTEWGEGIVKERWRTNSFAVDSIETIPLPSSNNFIEGEKSQGTIQCIRKAMDGKGF